jgi:hypothetical protein
MSVSFVHKNRSSNDYLAPRDSWPISVTCTDKCFHWFFLADDDVLKSKSRNTIFSFAAVLRQAQCILSSYAMQNTFLCFFSELICFFSELKQNTLLCFFSERSEICEPRYVEQKFWTAVYTETGKEIVPIQVYSIILFLQFTECTELCYSCNTRSCKL